MDLGTLVVTEISASKVVDMRSKRKEDVPLLYSEGQRSCKDEKDKKLSISLQREAVTGVNVDLCCMPAKKATT